MSEDLVEELFKDVRVIALILLVVGSLVSIYVYPVPPQGSGFRGNLEFGLDLEGGSWLQLQLEGTLVQIDASRNQIIEKELSIGISDLQIIDSDENSVTFTTSSMVSEGYINSLGYGSVTEITEGNGVVPTQVKLSTN